ncbi:MAG: YbaB/EbfC family nucleoid-associated protein [Clostridiaceae bacterium]|nr:YbaB/EbfC family nucleoid-associated protein [Clostridiaceae bacterium]
MAKNKYPKMGGNMNDMLKQAQKMQQQMESIQQDVENRLVEASAGGGAVTVTMNGKKEVKSIKIDPDIIETEDIEMLEDIVMAAVNEAISKANEMMTGEMGKLTGGINLPGLF